MERTDIYHNFITKESVHPENDTPLARVFVPRDRAKDFMTQFPDFSEEHINEDKVALSVEQIIESIQRLKESQEQSGSLTPSQMADLIQLNRAREDIEKALGSDENMASPFPNSITSFLESHRGAQAGDYAAHWQKNGISAISDFYFDGLLQNDSIRIYRPDQHGHFTQFNIRESDLRDLFSTKVNQCQFRRIEEAKKQYKQKTPAAQNNPKV